MPPAPAWAAHLMQAGVLYVVGSHLLLAFDLHADVQPDGSRHSRLVCPLVCGGTGRGMRCEASLEQLCSPLAPERDTGLQAWRGFWGQGQGDAQH